MKLTYAKVLLLATVLFIGLLTAARTVKSPVLVVFYGEGCPHCAEEIAFLNKLQESKSFSFEYYEVWYNQANLELLKEVAKKFKFQVTGVPTTIINGKVIVGFNEQIKQILEEQIDNCSKFSCPDPLAEFRVRIPEKPKPENPPTIEQNDSEKQQPPQSQNSENLIEIPIIGKVDAETLSLPMLTLVLATLDSFNPCAFFVLFFLLSLLARAGSKKRMIIIGSVFVFFSFLMYFLFMAAWLNFFIIVGNISIITFAAGIVAVLIGLINIKDFFALGQGITLSIPDEAKKKIVAKMKVAVSSASFPAMIGATILLAVAANTYELLCTAGFPMVFTRMLTLNNLQHLDYYLYLLAYNIIYVIPLWIIVIFFSLTLGGRRLTEEEGEMLKLVSGLMMLGLGLLLLFSPASLNNLFTGIALMIAAISIAFAMKIAFKQKRKTTTNSSTEQENKINKDS